MNNTLFRQPVEEDLINLIRSIRILVFDFDGVFTDNQVIVSEDGTESVLCNRSDGLGIVRLRQSDLHLMVLSTEVNPVVSARCRKLKIECVQGCEDKLVKLAEILEEKGLSFASAAFMGNDVNDLQCLQKVALPIVVSDAHPAVISSAKYITQTRGGHGAVREICDLFEWVIKEPKA